MKKLLLLLLLPFSAFAQSPHIKILYVDSAFMNQVSTWYLPQVAISGYFENLLHIPSITINGVSQSITNGATWTVSGGVTSVFTRTGAVTAQSGDYSSFYYPLSTNPSSYLTNASNINLLSKSANYTIASTDFSAGKQPILRATVDCTSGPVTLTLPNVSTFAGYIIYVTKSDATTNALTISGLSSDNVINVKGWTKEIISDATNWTQN